MVASRRSVRIARIIVIILGMNSLTASAASAQNFGNARHGGALAHSLCAECHGVEAGQKSKNEAAPPFGTIAQTGGMVGLALEAALNTSHRRMPNIMLSSGDRADIIAYIETLRQTKQSR